MFSNRPHYITSFHSLNEVIRLKTSVTPDAVLHVHETVLPDGAEVLLFAENFPYLFVYEIGMGRIVQWLGYEWMDILVRGPVWEMDDLLWKGFIWAARKPFVLRDLPHFATLRVDDCVGDHGQYKECPFEWVKIANKYGFKPWLGFFHDQIKENAVRVLRELIEEGQATAQIHGVELFGLVYQNQVHTKNGIQDTVNRWFEKHGGYFPLSNYLIPHAYDLTTEALPVIREKLGVEFLGIPYELDTGGGALSKTNLWLQSGPYRKQVEGTDGTPWTGVPVSRPLYYADWFLANGEDSPFFNVLSEIRDVNGYEWFNYAADDSQYKEIPNVIRNGTKILKRCFDSKVLGCLFTHEDSWRGKFIANITSGNWENMISGIVSNLSSLDLRFTTIDEALIYVRSIYTSKLESGSFISDNGQGVFRLQFGGASDCETEISVYLEDRGVILQQRYSLPPFDDGLSIEFDLQKKDLPEFGSIYDKEFPIMVGESEQPLSLGTRFYVNVPGTIEKVRFYATSGELGTYIVQLYEVESGTLLIDDLKWEIESGEEGWRELTLQKTVVVYDDREYIISISTNIEGPRYTYAYTPSGFCLPLTSTYITTVEGSGVHSNNVYDIPSIVDNCSSYFRDIVFRPHQIIESIYQEKECCQV